MERSTRILSAIFHHPGLVAPTSFSVEQLALSKENSFGNEVRAISCAPATTDKYFVFRSISISKHLVSEFDAVFNGPVCARDPGNRAVSDARNP